MLHVRFSISIYIHIFIYIPYISFFLKNIHRISSHTYKNLKIPLEVEEEYMNVLLAGEPQ